MGSQREGTHTTNLVLVTIIDMWWQFPCNIALKNHCRLKVIPKHLAVLENECQIHNYFLCIGLHLTPDCCFTRRNKDRKKK